MGRFATIVVSGASLVIALISAEVFVRWYYPAPWYGYAYTPPQVSFFEHDDLLGWRGRPNASGVFAGRDYLTRVHHDGFGHRSRTAPVIAGKINVLVVGDSYAWGWGVEDDEIFPELMMAGNPEMNVYNLSAPGYATDQQYLALKRFLERDPSYPLDGVIVQIYCNDFQEVTSDTAHDYPKPVFSLTEDELSLRNVPVPERPPEVRRPPAQDSPLGFLGHSQLVNLTAGVAGAMKDRWYSREQPESDTAPTNPRGVDLVAHLIGKIQELCNERGAFLHVAWVEPRDDRESKELKRNLDHLGIGVTEYTARSLPHTNLWLDGHMNAYGHRVLARQLLEDLERYSQPRRASLGG